MRAVPRTKPQGTVPFPVPPSQVRSVHLDVASTSSIRSKAFSSGTFGEWGGCVRPTGDKGGPLAVGDSADSAAHKPQFPFPCTLLVSPLPSHEIHELGDEIAMSFGPAPSVCYPSVTGFQTFSSTSVRSPQKSHRLGFTDERALHYAPAFIDRYCGVANEGRKKKKTLGGWRQMGSTALTLGQLCVKVGTS